MMHRSNENFPINLIGECRHSKTTKIFSVFYCSVLSILFVAALYVLVPKQIRKLDRDHPLHIQRRALSSLIVCSGAVLTYPLLFCEEKSTTESSDPGNFSIFQVIFHPRGMLGVLLHTLILYLGPIVISFLRFYEFRKLSTARGTQPNWFNQAFQYFAGRVKYLINPSSEEERWRNIRNFLLAPWTEELIFRGCMVPCLLASGMTTIQVTFVAPLFFGFAHLHHAALRLSKGEPLTRVVIGTCFQFAYTSLFGSYVAYALIRSGSVFAVFLSHAYCNWMGLPDLSFLQKKSSLNRYRIPLGITYIIGIYWFKRFFSTDRLLPLPPKLDFYYS
jgi:prenyl protein peptidase